MRAGGIPAGHKQGYLANKKRVQQKRLNKSIPDLNSSSAGLGPFPVEGIIAAPFRRLFLLNQRISRKGSLCKKPYGKPLYFNLLAENELYRIAPPWGQDSPEFLESPR